MMQSLDMKIRQMHAALGQLENTDLSSVKPEIKLTPTRYHCMVDFSQGKDEIELANAVTLLINNIACLKDHLKAWCETNGRRFEGDALIDSDTNVAIIHDLWNIDKHAGLNKPSRCGFTPRIDELHQALRLRTGGGTGSRIGITMNPAGQMSVNASGGGSAALAVTGTIVDENGTIRGDLAAICENAVSAWEKTLVKAGVQIQ